MALRIKLGDRGRLVLPAVLRRRMGLRMGDVLIVEQVAEGELRLVSARHALAELHGRYAQDEHEGSLVEDLERERRAEAEREEREARVSMDRAIEEEM